MIGYSTVTQKGQITIPADIRRELGLEPGEKVVIRKEAQGASIAPAPDFFSLGGSLKSTKQFSLKAERKSAKQLLGKQHEKSA